MPWINKTKKIKQQAVRYEGVSTKYYRSTQWRNLRARYLREHPFCAECAKEGRTTLATEVHHVIPFLQGIGDQGRWALLLDEDNLMSLCSECHHRIHGEIEKKKHNSPLSAG